MATTSPDNLRTPNPGDPYNLVADLATFANDVQVALNKKVSNLLVGTAAARVAATSTSSNGMLWQDTDGIKMLWRKDGTAWVPAVWRWSGTTSQMNGFTQAPNGFEWLSTTDNKRYVRLSGAWNGGDTGWNRIDAANSKIGTLGPGVTHRVAGEYTGLMARAKDGVLYLSGSVSGSLAANAVICTVDPAYRIGATSVQYAYTGSANFVAYNYLTGEVRIALAAGGYATFGLSGPIGP